MKRILIILTLSLCINSIYAKKLKIKVVSCNNTPTTQCEGWQTNNSTWQTNGECWFTN